MKKTKNKKNRFSRKNETLISKKNYYKKTRMKKNKVKSRKRARGLSNHEQDLLLDNLRFLNYNHQPLSSSLDSITLFDLHSIIKKLTYQIDHNFILPEYLQFNKDLLDTLNFIALQKKSKIDFSPKIPSLTKKIHQIKELIIILLILLILNMLLNKWLSRNVKFHLKLLKI